MVETNDEILLTASMENITVNNFEYDVIDVMRDLIEKHMRDEKRRKKAETNKKYTDKKKAEKEALKLEHPELFVRKPYSKPRVSPEESRKKLNIRNINWLKRHPEIRKKYNDLHSKMTKNCICGKTVGYTYYSKHLKTCKTVKAMHDAKNSEVMNDTENAV